MRMLSRALMLSNNINLNWMQLLLQGMRLPSGVRGIRGMVRARLVMKLIMIK